MPRRILWILAALFAITAAKAEEAAKPETVSFKKGPYTVRVERSHFIPMRDGVRLSTDLYFPEGYEGKLPVIIERTPYDKSVHRSTGPDAPISLRSLPYYYATHGYVVAVQDRRGKFESEGQYTIQNGDVSDANDTLDWFSGQPWFSGKSSFIGCSIPGGNTIRAAQTLHPNLTSLVPQSAAFGHGTAGGTMAKAFLRGGIQNMTMPLWTHYSGSKLFFRPPTPMARDDYLKIRDYFDIAPDVGAATDVLSADGTLTDKGREVLLHLPLVDIDDKMKSLPSDWDDIAARAPMDPWWDRGDYLENDTKVDGAALHINSWHDYGVNETMLQFTHFQGRARSKWARENQYLIISPLGHCNAESVSSQTKSGDRDLGDARFDFWGTYLQWWDYTLKGKIDAFAGTPRVQYYLPGKNEWRATDAWPIPGTQRQTIYLTSGGKANTRMGDGELSFSKPKSTGTDNYIYDPADPVFLGLRDYTDGAFDAREMEMRPDVLVYTSAPLKEGLEMTGKIKAKVWLSTDVPDTDLRMRLLDVYPDGAAYPVQASQLRLRYREGYDREVMMEPGTVYAIDLDMLVGANYFQVGHKIRIEITSSSMPNFARNLNTGGDNARSTQMRKAAVTIHHGPQRPSHIDLPIIARADTDQKDH